MVSKSEYGGRFRTATSGKQRERTLVKIILLHHPGIEKGEIWQKERQQHFFAKNADMKQANG